MLSDAPEVSSEEFTAIRIRLTGSVQGMGVRPAIARLADAFSIRGVVRNTSDGVEIFAEGTNTNLKRFTRSLETGLPIQSHVLKTSEETITCVGVTGFRIESETSTDSLAVHVPPDRVICAECLRELTSPDDRRSHYAFLTCTSCGPRYSLISSMPHERAHTSLRTFPMCSRCRQEFDDLQNRRCHAETMTCPDCGPQVTFLSCRTSAGVGSVTDSVNGLDAIRSAATIITAGGLLLVKGLGGFQFVCDAGCDSAVQTIRRIKRRERKPLAVMLSRNRVPDLIRETVEWKMLMSDANPIVVSEEFHGRFRLSPLVSEYSTVGAFLPTTALHELLIEACGVPLVVTSGNVEGEPIEYRDSEAVGRLSILVDGILTHDREILHPVDDSVVRMIAGRAVPVRSARGLTPAPISILSADQGFPGEKAILAVGAQQKVALVLGNGRQVVLAPYLGDLQSIASRERFESEVRSLCSLYRCSPKVIACDLHPDYFTSRWAEESGLEVVKVQHHHAHVATAIVEHGLMEDTVLGVAFDGTGYGADGTIWGGEFLRASLSMYERVGSLRQFVLPGGERAVREVWRVAGCLLREAFTEWSAQETSVWLQNHLGLNLPLSSDVLHEEVLQHSVKTSSMGRLFDGVACLITKAASADFEGEPACRLESQCDESDPERYSLPITPDHDGLLIGDWRPMIRQIVQDLESQVNPDAVAMRFHRTIAFWIHEMALISGLKHVVLAGGCFQNRVLTECTLSLSNQQTYRLCIPEKFPPNDGGIAVGQYAIASYQRT